MYVHPKYEQLTGRPPPVPRTAEPPVEAPTSSGTRLVTLPRSNQRDGSEDELRVELAEFGGHPYLSLRIWRRNAQGQFWPQQGKGISIRLKEAADVADALRSGLRLADQARPARPTRRDDRQPALPLPAANGNPFDEFG